MTFVLGMNCTCCVRVEFVLCARCVLRFNFGLGNLHTLTFQFNNSGAYLKHSKGYITWNPEALSIFIFPNHIYIYIKIIVFQYIPAYAQLPRLVLMCYSNHWLLNNESLWTRAWKSFTYIFPSHRLIWTWYPPPLLSPCANLPWRHCN